MAPLMPHLTYGTGIIIQAGKSVQYDAKLHYLFIYGMAECFKKDAKL